MREIYRCLSFRTLFTRHAQITPQTSRAVVTNVTITDEDGAFSDWIEIHNPMASAINLANYTLTDTLNDPAPWRFPAPTLQPGEFLVVWAPGKNRTTAGLPLHTSFSLAKGGEYLELSLESAAEWTEDGFAVVESVSFAGGE